MPTIPAFTTGVCPSIEQLPVVFRSPSATAALARGLLQLGRRIWPVWNGWPNPRKGLPPMVTMPTTPQDAVVLLARRLRVDVCTLYVYDEPAEELVLVASAGLLSSAIGYRLPVGSGLTGRVARMKQPVSVKYPARHPEYHYVPGSGEERLQSYLGLPLFDLRQLLGVMVVQTEAPRVFRLNEIEGFYRAGKELLGNSIVRLEVEPM